MQCPSECEIEAGKFERCEREAGHDGVHVACDGLARWLDEQEKVYGKESWAAGDFVGDEEVKKAWDFGGKAGGPCGSSGSGDPVKRAEKPVYGVLPFRMWVARRMDALLLAMAREVEAGRDVPDELESEYVLLLEWRDEL